MTDDKTQWGCGLCTLNDYRKKSGLTCSFVIFTALNVTMVVIGSKNVYHCPIELMIPIYLVVAGSTSLALLLVRLVVSHVLVPSLQSSGTSTPESLGEDSKLKATLDPNEFPIMEMMVKGLKVFDTVASIFSTCWLIVGSYYVYGAKPVFDDHLSKGFCDYTSYMCAFIVITIGYISLGLSVLAALISCLCNRGEDY